MNVFHFEANNNRYEGKWKMDKKSGAGKFYFLNKGQLLEGFWIDDINKSGKFVDFNREKATEPTKYEIPEVNKKVLCLNRKMQDLDFRFCNFRFT